MPLHPPLDVVPKIDETPSSGKSAENRSMPLVLVGVKWTAVGAVPERLVLESSVLTSFRPRPWGDPPPKRSCFGEGKANMGCSMAVANAQTALILEARPIQSGRDGLTGPQVLEVDEVGADILRDCQGTWTETANASKSTTKLAGASRSSPASCNWLSSSRLMSNPSEANSELAGNRCGHKDFALPKVFRKAVPPRGGRGNTARA